MIPTPSAASSTPKRALGNRMEALALGYLKQHGLTLLAQNYATRWGELDLVMKEGSSCVFVEVRYRRDTRHGTPCESITPRKQRRLVLAARHYLMCCGKDAPCRFDVISLCGAAPHPDTHWIRHAFDAY